LPSALQHELVQVRGAAHADPQRPQAGAPARRADQRQQVLQSGEGGLGGEVATQETEVLLGVAPARVRLLVEQLVGVGAPDAGGEVLEEGACQVHRRDLLGDAGLLVGRPAHRVVDARLGRPDGLAARDRAAAR
jgi:hypothetical protein